MLTIDVTLSEENKDGVIKREWYLFMRDGRDQESRAQQGLIGIAITEEKANEIFRIYNCQVLPKEEDSNLTTYRVMWAETTLPY